MSGSTMSPDSTDTMTNKTINSTNNTITITESTISDLGTYLATSDVGVGFSASRTTNQSISNATYTTVLFDKVDGTEASNDDNSSYATGTGIWTCKKAGKWNISVELAFAPNATGRRLCRTTLNGDSDPIMRTTIDSWGSASTTVPMNKQQHLEFALNDTLRIRAYQDSGGALNIEGGDRTRFSASWAGS